MKIVNELSDEVVLRELGIRFAQERILRRLTQDALAKRAGIAKRSVERLEKGEGGVRLQIVIAVARALRCLSGLDALVPEAMLQPLEIRDGRTQLVKRVRNPKRSENQFKWGE